MIKNLNELSKLTEKDISLLIRLLDLYEIDTNNYMNISVLMWYNMSTHYINYNIKKRIEKQIKDYKKIMKRSNKWFYLNGNFSY